MGLESQNLKFVKAITPASASGGSHTATVVDTRGAAYVTYLVDIGNIAADMTALKLTECDTSGGTYTDVAGAIFGTSTNTAGSTSTLPTAASSDDTYVAIRVNLQGRKPYQKIVSTAGAGATVVGVIAILEGVTPIPSTETARGFAQVLEVPNL